MLFDTVSNTFIPVVCKREINSSKIELFKVDFEENSGYYHLGHYFVFIEKFSIYSSYDNKGDIDEKNYSYILFIPDIQNNDLLENGYTIITEDWKTLRKNNEYGFVFFPKKMFNIV